MLEGGLFVTHPAPLAYKPNAELGFSLLSDLHIGCANVDHDQIDRELDLAYTRKDRILINGDIADLILTKDHKRYSPSALHPRLQGRADLVNAALDFAYEILYPYASRIDVIGIGNHESKAIHHHDFDFVSELVKKLRTGVRHCNTVYGGYAGFVRYEIQSAAWKTPQSLNFFYWHGAGGGASASSAAQEFDKKSFVEGADVVWFAHKHLRMAYEVERLSPPWTLHEPVPRTRRQWNVRTGSYFHTYPGQTQEGYARDGRQASYAADSLLPPQGRGGARVVLRFGRDTTSAGVPCEKNLRVEFSSLTSQKV